MLIRTIHQPPGIYKWSLLNDGARSIVNALSKEWAELINQPEKEELYHTFLAANAGFFLCDFHLKFFCISKLRLGADYVIDFAVPKEGYSNGLTWELIEIETPHIPPYTLDGIPSARLSRAIQQIQDWKRWMSENRREAEKLFPGYGVRTTRNPNFKFTVIIGNRANSARWLEKRNQYAKDIKIGIRSFSYLSNLIKERYFGDSTYIGSSEEQSMSQWERNNLVNPFSSAFSDVQWRALVSEYKAGAHFVPKLAPKLLLYRPYNIYMFEKFQAKFFRLSKKAKRNRMTD